MSAGASGTQPFTLTNNGTESEVYFLSCSKSGQIQSCSVPSTLSVARLHSGNFTLSFTAASTGGSGTITVTASGNVLLTATVNVTVSQATPLVTPKDSSVTVPPSSPRSQNFVVKNNGSASGTFNLTLDCSGAESACSGAPASVTLASGAQSTVTASYTSGSSGTTGKVQLLAALSGGTPKDSGWVNVTSSSSGALVAPQVALVNSDSLVEPGLCLTLASASHSAYECGALRVVHTLPATRSMNTLRVPTLFYNSEHAQPTPLVAANVTLPSGGASPDTVAASVVLNGRTWTQKWAGNTGWPSGGVSKRVAVSLDGYTLSGSVVTAIPSYTLSVSNCYNGSGCQAAATIAGRLVVVDRSASPFGAGWWLAGLESLDPSSMIWTGGDGSVRQYISAGANLWRAPSVDRPDTIVRDPSSGNYTRYLPHAARVIFNSAGQHVQTVNRLGQITQFAYSGSQLQSITLPVISGSAPVYTFSFSASQAQVTAPPVNGVARVTTLTLSSGRVTSIFDPDHSLPSVPTTSFSYDGSSNRIAARFNKTNGSVRFGYGIPDRKLVVDSVLLEGTVPSLRYAIRAFAPAESRGVNLPVLTDSVYTYVNGPRQNVNVLSAWVDRFGEPTLIKDALGNQTQLIRANASFPALVTEMHTPNGIPGGLVSRAEYDAHGNIAADTVLGPFGGSKAVTLYGWDSRFDFVTGITPPAGPSTSISYDALGNRVWQQTGTDTTRRIYFYYNSGGGPSNGLLRAVATPKAAGVYMQDSIYYDAMGNLYKTRSPLGRWHFVLRDAIGRDTLSISPIRASDSDSTASITFRARTRTTYDLMDRDSIVMNIGPADTAQSVTIAAETSFVHTDYDNEGRPFALYRWSRPDVASAGTLMSQWQYDYAGRTIVEIAPDGAQDHYALDAAGNDTAWTNRRGQTVRMQYDALNRLSQRITPRDSTPAWTDPYAQWMYNPGVISGDTATFTYTPSGAIATAYNGSAKVSRAYFPNGAIQADTQRVRTWDPAGSFEFHKYVVGFTYDLAGRRTVLQVPSVLVAPFAGTTIGYSYDANTGALSTVTALDGQQFRYHDDLAGRLDSLIAPTANGGQSLTTAFSHSDDGDLLQRIQMSGGAPFHRDSLLYDARGKIVKSYTMIDSTFTVYSGLGNLLYAKHRSPTGYQNWEETFTVDALGNQHQKIGTGFQGKNPMNNNTTYTYASGRLTNSSDSQGGGSAGQNIFDAGGNRTMSYSQTGSYLEEIKSYYAHDGMLRKVDRRVCGSTTTCSSSARGAYEDYRYDALGRRVLVRSQRNWCTSGGDCRSSIMRVVWDGDQILGEIRMPGYSTTSADTLEADTLSFTPPPGPSCPPLPPPEGCNPADTLPSAAPYYGHVTYTHGLGIDQPLEVLRGGFRSSVQDQFAIVPLADRRGLYDNGVFPQSGPVIKWPASSTEILKYDLDADDDRGNWMGGLIYQNRDMGGSQYMRNRYYDAATGRFTQEDPIGMAGGLNLYGFAAGDPVNYTDPFGLLDCNKKTGEGCSEEYKRLIGYDQPIETPLIDPVEVVADVASGGLVGVGKVAAEGASEAAAKSAAKATGRKLTRWGWEEGAKHRTAVKQLAKESLSPITHESVGGIIPTAEEATEMIGKGGGKVLRVEAGHAPAVSTHTYPHINYVTKGGTKATVRIQ